jgi:phosphoribosylformylglycinamidine synthase
VVREAVYQTAAVQPLSLTESPPDPADALLKILGSLNVASKEWVIRQYDHEVQGGSVVKPLVGAASDGPGDAAVVRPVLGSRRGLVISCGMNPRYGDFDTYWMAASAIDEAVRNCVAVGADPAKIALLDNFCWGNTDRPETLGSLVRAALACRDLALELCTPFVSGKDSLNNEFRYIDADGAQQLIVIPPSLLISAIGQIDDVGRAITMDLKEPDNLLYLVGTTRSELAGSHLALVHGLDGGDVPTVQGDSARRLFSAVHSAIAAGLVRSCHDLSEGGLAVAAAEMAFAGGIGARIELGNVPADVADDHQEEIDIMLLFSESNTRFLCEVSRASSADFERRLAGAPHACIGKTMTGQRLEFFSSQGAAELIDLPLDELKAAWKFPLAW